MAYRHPLGWRVNFSANGRKFFFVIESIDYSKKTTLVRLRENIGRDIAITSSERYDNSTSLEAGKTLIDGETGCVFAAWKIGTFGGLLNKTPGVRGLYTGPDGKDAGRILVRGRVPSPICFRRSQIHLRYREDRSRNSCSETPSHRDELRAEGRRPSRRYLSGPPFWAVVSTRRPLRRRPLR